MPRVEFRSSSRGLLTACGLAALLVSGTASAGLLFDPPEGGYPELPIKPAPAFNPDKTIPIAMPVGGSLLLSVDPATISSDSDGVVRYVSIARNKDGSSLTATYEGVRCQSGEVKLYARHYTDGDWRPIPEPKWQSLVDSGAPRYSMAIAKAGICQDAAPGGNARAIIQTLRDDGGLLNSP